MKMPQEDEVDQKRIDLRSQLPFLEVLELCNHSHSQHRKIKELHKIVLNANNIPYEKLLKTEKAIKFITQRLKKNYPTLYQKAMRTQNIDIKIEDTSKKPNVIDEVVEIDSEDDDAVLPVNNSNIEIQAATTIKKEMLLENVFPDDSKSHETTKEDITSKKVLSDSNLEPSVTTENLISPERVLLDSSNSSTNSTEIKFPYISKNNNKLADSKSLVIDQAVSTVSKEISKDDGSKIAICAEKSKIKSPDKPPTKLSQPNSAVESNNNNDIIDLSESGPMPTDDLDIQNAEQKDEKSPNSNKNVNQNVKIEKTTAPHTSGTELSGESKEKPKNDVSLRNSNNSMYENQKASSTSGSARIENKASEMVNNSIQESPVRVKLESPPFIDLASEADAIKQINRCHVSATKKTESRPSIKEVIALQSKPSLKEPLSLEPVSEASDNCCSLYLSDISCSDRQVKEILPKKSKSPEEADQSTKTNSLESDNKRVDEGHSFVLEVHRHQINNVSKEKTRKILKRKKKRKHKRRNKSHSNQQCSNDDNSKKSMEKEKRRSRTNSHASSPKRVYYESDIDSDSDHNLDRTSLRSEIRTGKRIVYNREDSSSEMKKSRCRRQLKIETSRSGPKKCRSNSSHRRSDDSCSRSSSTDDYRIHYRKHKVRSPKISSGSRRDDRHRRRRSFNCSSEDKDARKYFPDDCYRKYRRSSKYSDDDTDDQYRRHRRSPKRTSDRKAERSSQKRIDDDRYRYDKYNKSRRHYSDEDNESDTQDELRNSRKRSRDVSRRSSIQEIAESRSNRNNQSSGNTSREMTSKKDIPSKDNKDKLHDTINLIDSSDDDNGVAIEVSDDDDTFETPPNSVNIPVIDMSYLEEKDTAVDDKTENDKPNVSEQHVVKKELVSANADPKISSDIKEMLEQIIYLMQKPSANVKENQSMEPTIPKIDLADYNENQSAKPLEQRNLDELKELRTKLEKNMGISIDERLAILRAVKDDSLVAGQIMLLISQLKVNASAIPSPNDPQLNRTSASALNSTPTSDVASSFIPVPDPAAVTPPNGLTQASIQNDCKQDNPEIFTGLNRSIQVTLDEYRQLKNIRTRQERRSVADWDEEFKANNTKAIQTPKKELNIFRPEDESNSSNSKTDESRSQVIVKTVEAVVAEPWNNFYKSKTTSATQTNIVENVAANHKNGNEESTQSESTSKASTFSANEIKIENRVYDFSLPSVTQRDEASQTDISDKRKKNDDNENSGLPNSDIEVNICSTANQNYTKDERPLQPDSEPRSSVFEKNDEVIEPSMLQSTDTQTNIDDRNKKNYGITEEKSTQSDPDSQLHFCDKSMKSHDKVIENHDRPLDANDKIKSMYTKNEEKFVQTDFDLQLNVHHKKKKSHRKEKEKSVQEDPNSQSSNFDEKKRNDKDNEKDMQLNPNQQFNICDKEKKNRSTEEGKSLQSNRDRQLSIFDGKKKNKEKHLQPDRNPKQDSFDKNIKNHDKVSEKIKKNFEEKSTQSDPDPQSSTLECRKENDKGEHSTELNSNLQSDICEKSVQTNPGPQLIICDKLKQNYNKEKQQLSDLKKKRKNHEKLNVKSIQSNHDHEQLKVSDKKKKNYNKENKTSHVSKLNNCDKIKKNDDKEKEKTATDPDSQVKVSDRERKSDKSNENSLQLNSEEQLNFSDKIRVNNGKINDKPLSPNHHKLNSCDNMERKDDKEKEKSTHDPDRKLHGSHKKKKKKKDKRHEKSLRMNSDEHLNISDNKRINYDKVNEKHRSPNRDTECNGSDNMKKNYANAEEYSNPAERYPPVPPLVISLKSIREQNIRTPKTVTPKRKNELEKLTSAIGELKNCDDYSSAFARRRSSIMSELKTKEMSKTIEDQLPSRAVSSESETEGSYRNQLPPVKTMSTGKKRSFRPSIDDNDDTLDFFPPLTKHPANLESATENSSLPSLTKEAPFAEKHKRSGEKRHRKSKHGIAKKTKKDVVKNTDISLHFNSPHSQNCVICNENEPDIVEHYVKIHPRNEVFVSRLDPHQVKDLMATPFYATPVPNSTRIFIGTCVFCSQIISDTLAYFMQHFATHTGEFAYECDGCKIRYPRMQTIASHCSTHCKKDAKVSKIYQYDLSGNVIKAYICNLCNFMQLNSINIVKHLRTEHDQPFVTTKDYGPLTILEVRKNIEPTENEEDIEVNVEVPDEGGIESYEDIEPNTNLEAVPTSANNANSQPSLVGSNETEFGFQLNRILNDSSQSDRNDLNIVPKLEIKPEPASLDSSDDMEILFVVETASDSNNCQSTIKYQKAYGTKLGISQVDGTRTVVKSSAPDLVPAVAQAVLCSNSNSSGSKHHVLAREAVNTVLHKTEETRTSSKRSSPQPKSTSNILHDPTILRIMAVGFQEVAVNNYKYYCLFENCEFLPTENINELGNHFKLMHNNRQWNGNCSICSKRVMKHWTSLDKEISHLLSQHVQQKVVNTSQEGQSLSSSFVSAILKPWHEQPSKSRKSKEVCTMLLHEDHLSSLYKCMGPNCIYTTLSSWEIKKHMLAHNGDSSALECCYCERSFSTSDVLIDHISSVHGNSNYQCSHCFYRSCAAYNVQIHQRLIHGEVNNTKILVCQGQGSTISKEITTILKNRKKNIQPNKCPACRKSIYVKQFFNNHLKKRHPQHQHIDAYFATYECLYCSFGTCDLYEIRKHMSNKHPCRLLYVCGRVFIKECHPMSLQAQIDITDLKTTSLVYIGDLVNKRKFQMKNPDQLQNLALMEAVNSGLDASQLNSRIFNIYGESVLNFNHVEAHMKKIASGIQLNGDFPEELSELDQLVNAATIETGLIGKSLYRCGFSNCTRSVENFRQFDAHILSHRAKRDALYTCPHCKRNLPLNRIRRHTIDHRRHRYLCYYCGETSASQDYSMLHLKKAHSKLNVKTFVFLTTDKNCEPSSIDEEGQIFAAISRQDSQSGDIVAAITNVLRKRYDKTIDSFDENSKSTTEERPKSPVESKDEIPTPVFVSLDSRFVCNINECPFKAKTDEELSQHLRDRHSILSTGKYSCPHCSYTINTPQVKINRIQKHLQYHGQKITVCNICNYYHFNRDSVLLHIETAHQYNFVTMDTATRTSQSTKHKIEIIYSRNIKSPEDSYNCTLCDNILIDCEEIYAHMKSMHQLNVRFGCGYCGFFDNSFQTAEMHVKTTHITSKLRIRSFFVPDGAQGGCEPFELLLVERSIANVSDSSNIGYSRDIETIGECSANGKRRSISGTDSDPPSKQIKISEKDERKSSEDNRKSERDSKRRKRNKSSKSKDQVQIKATNENLINPRISEPAAGRIGSVKVVPLEKLMPPNITNPNTSVQTMLHSPLHMEPVNHTIGSIFLICRHCDMHFNDYNSLVFHYHSNHRNNPFHFCITKKLLCLYCTYVSTFSNMKTHHFDKHPNEIFITLEANNPKKCAECPYEFNSPVYNEQILAHHHSMHLKIDSSFSYLNQQFIDGLLRLGQSSTLFKCTICRNIYAKLSLCQSHIERSHGSSNSIENVLQVVSIKLLYGCHHYHCQIFFETEMETVKHIRKHINPYGCKFCENNFASHSALLKHYKIVHKTEDLSYRLLNISDYLKTLMKMLLLFPNGLVLSKVEAGFTDYGRIGQFVEMIENMEKTELQNWTKKESIARIKRDLEIEGNRVCPEY